MEEEGERLVGIINTKIENGSVIYVEKLFLMCTLDVICRSALGKTVDAQNCTESTYVKAIERWAIVDFYAT